MDCSVRSIAQFLRNTSDAQRYIVSMVTPAKPNLKSNEPGQTHNETDGSTRVGFVGCEPAVQLSFPDLGDLRNNRKKVEENGYF